MLKKLFLYAIGIYVLGLIFSGITSAITDFIPYFIAGMIVTMPVYGAVRNKRGKGIRVSEMILAPVNLLKRLAKFNKNSISMYLIIIIVVTNTYQYIGEALVEGLVVGIITFAVTYSLWEGTRYVMKKMKNITFISYGEAIKGAF